MTKLGQALTVPVSKQPYLVDEKHVCPDIPRIKYELDLVQSLRLKAEEQR